MLLVCLVTFPHWAHVHPEHLPAATAAFEPSSPPNLHPVLGKKKPSLVATAAEHLGGADLSIQLRQGEVDRANLKYLLSLEKDLELAPEQTAKNQEPTETADSGKLPIRT